MGHKIRGEDEGGRYPHSMQSWQIGVRFCFLFLPPPNRPPRPPVLPLPVPVFVAPDAAAADDVAAAAAATDAARSGKHKGVCQFAVRRRTSPGRDSELTRLGGSPSGSWKKKNMRTQGQ